jgi:3-deoxy-D-manno-octulosonate 8-phosphate phosphatase (KDO 8-P phosphatase)
VTARAVPLARIQVLVLDVDGVLTDGRLFYADSGEQMKSFHVRDGYGINALRAAGITVAVISGRRSLATQHRCRELGIERIALGVSDKGVALAALCASLNVDPAACACVGDDVPDVAMLQSAGLAIAVADAHPALRGVTHRRTRARGGHGAVREVCDWLLAARQRRPRT